MSRDLYLAEIVAYDPGVPGAVTLRYATRGFVTGPAETPANTIYDYRLKQPVNVTRDCFASGTTSGASRVGFGDLVLLNPDGVLDALAGYGFDGRAVTIRHATADSPAFPGDFTTVFVGTMEQATCGMDEVTIRLRDRQYETQVPLQTSFYLGDNALPAGLEGTADDLKGKPKPVCLGTVSNVPAPCVNTSKLIYQVNDGAVASIPNVYDRGIGLWGDGPWVNVTLPGATFSGGAVACGGGYIVVAGSLAVGTPTIYYSDDEGATWATGSHTFTAGLYAVIYDGAQFVGFSVSGEVETSPTGAAWTSQTAVGHAVTGACYDATDGLYVAVGTGLSTSPTLATWTARTSSFGATGIERVASDGLGHYVAVGYDAKAAHSTGATTWAQVTVGWASTASGADISYLNGLWIATTYSRYLYTSTDREGWKAVDLGATRFVRGGCYGDGHYVLVASAGYVLTSADGDAWEWLAVTGSWIHVGSTGTTFCAVGGHHVINSVVGGSGYADAADLEDDTLAPSGGAYRTYLAGGYFRLGATPAGLVTADVTQGAAAANRTAAQLANVVIARAIGGASFAAADVTALDAADASVLGFWQGTEETTCAAVLDAIAGTVGAWWGCNQLGAFRIKQLVRPTGTAAAEFVSSDVVKGSFARLATLDAGNGLPAYRVTLRWGRVYAVQDTDLAAGVTDARRGVISKEWREAVATDAFVQTAHPLAIATVEDTLYSTAADALTEATRRLALRNGRCDRYEITVALDAATAVLDLGDVVTLTYARFDLTAGKRFVILGVAPDVMRRTVRFTLWGTQQYVYGTAAPVVAPTLSGTGTKT
jgi:hypothetical protein